jgi:large subunit ribosomal protein L4
MPVNTVRWIELVFGEGLSAEEASERIRAALEAEGVVEESEESEESGDAAEASEESEASPEDEKE